MVARLFPHHKIRAGGMNVHPKIVQELLGHNQISMTMNLYSHVLPGMQEEVMDRLEEILDHPKDEESDGDIRG